MRLLRLFLAHEATTQFRSARYRGIAALYVIAASTPAAITYLVAGRVSSAIGPATYNALTLSEQPLLTVLLAVVVSVDAIARERDEGSFAVLSVAPISSAGYLFRRWIAVVTLCIPLTLLPPIVGAALAFDRTRQVPLPSAFAGGWLLHVLPALLISSAMAMALGTITGRATLAIIFGALLLTIGIGLLNDVLAHVHRHFEAPVNGWGDLDGGIQQLVWLAHGYWIPWRPTDAAFPLRSEAAMVLPRAGITAAIALVLFASSAFYLRRTRRDLRPWKIRQTHPIRTLLQTANRIREEYAPDSGSDGFDRLFLVFGCALAAALIGTVMHRQSAFALLAEERYEAEVTEATATSTALVPRSLRIVADVALGGTIHSHGTLVMRNAGERPESHLSFALSPGVAVQRISASRGSFRVRRAWQRLDVDIDPPIAAGESRQFAFELSGVPSQIEFELQSPGDFADRWRRYREAKQSIYMTDLSLSTMTPAANEARMNLSIADLAPMPRYTPWRLQTEDRGGGFRPEAISPPALIDVHLRHPYAFAADSCGSLSNGAMLSSRCAIGIASYAIFGGPFAEEALGQQATLAYIPAHERLARIHAAALASSMSVALDSWPGLKLPPRLIFVERPRSTGERTWYFEGAPWLSISQLGSGGALVFVPEGIFTQLKGLNAGFFAASMISESLRARRPVVAREATFFSSFYTAVALAHIGGQKTDAVASGTGPTPDTTPLLDARGFYQAQQRMMKVLASIEYRVGADHFVEGINDFAAGGPSPGDAKALLDAIGRRGGVDLSRAYSDYFSGNALPQLTLSGVSFRRSGSRWDVSGTVVNRGTGEAFVPLALRTSAGSLWQTLRVDGGARVPFTFSTEAEPRSLQLDPNRVCYRFAAIGTVDSVDYRGGS